MHSKHIYLELRLIENIDERLYIYTYIIHSSDLNKCDDLRQFICIKHTFVYEFEYTIDEMELSDDDDGKYNRNIVPLTQPISKDLYICKVCFNRRLDLFIFMNANF